MGRSVGRSIVEFKRGIKGIEEEIEDEASRPAPKIEERAEPRRDLPADSADPVASADATDAESVGSKQA